MSDNKKRIEEKLKKIRDSIIFCKKCGEYVTDDGSCSNPWCPEEQLPYSEKYKKKLKEKGTDKIKKE